jgi:hypothetical protein
MFTNGRSTSPAGHLIQTTDEKRQATWLHVFGTDTLPVLAATPRWQEQQGRAFPVLAYDLALGQLSDAQRARFAGYLSKKYRMDYTAVLNELETAVSWPIKASFDIQVLEPAEEQAPLAFLLRWPGNRKRPLPRLVWPPGSTGTSWGKRCWLRPGWLGRLGCSNGRKGRRVKYAHTRNNEDCLEYKLFRIVITHAVT